MAIHLPELPINLWVPDDNASAGQPVAILEQRKVCRANAAASARGVRPGISAATAAALCGQLVLRERQPAQESRRLAQLAQSALAFTPQVCIEAADAPTLLLEISGCLRLFRGLAALRARITAHVAAQDVTACFALAHTPLAAHLLASNGVSTHALFDDNGNARLQGLQAALAALPVTGLGLGNRTEESLMQMGFRQFSDIESRPRQALGRRFGNGFIEWLDRITGTRADPRQPIAPETFYVREVNFLDGIQHSEGLAFPMQRLLGDFAQFLRQHQLATQQITWRFTHVDRSSQEIVLNTTRPETAPAQLLALTRVRLDTTRLPAPVETLRLACRRFVPLAAPDRLGQLFPVQGNGVENAAGVSTLIDRLRARLGDAHCRQFTPVDVWRPEAAQQVVVAGTQTRKKPLVRVRLAPGETAAVPAMPVPAHRHRPLWLMREPARVHQQGTQLQWHGALDIVSGPERLDSDWWAQPLQRDYFVAYHEAGTLCWVFHDRAQGAWFVQGVFG